MPSCLRRRSCAERCSDGWSAGRQAAFLAHLADNGLVEDAARSVGMSVSGGYALRRQARGFAFHLGWEAAVIVARRIIADRLLTAAIKGKEARWVREDGVTTYTRQNAKLSLALLDRVDPARSPPEVLAVALRFDCYLQMLDEGLNGRDLWEWFFDEALSASDRETRARVRHSLLLSEESAGFEEEKEEEEQEPLDAQDPPIEYKSMDGPPHLAHDRNQRMAFPVRNEHDTEIDMPLPHDTLVLVADGKKMLLLRNQGDEVLLDLRTEEHDQQSLPKDSEIKSDLAGQSPAPGGTGLAGGTMGEVDYQRQAEDRWAADTAELINKRTLANKLDNLAVIAPPKTMGELRKHWHKETARRIVMEITKEMTDRPIPDIEGLIAGEGSPPSGGGG